MAKRITLRPIGWVRNGWKEWGPRWRQVVSEIVLDPEHAERLDGIDGFSHIQVLFYMERVSPKERRMERFHPMDREDLPVVGAFATRSQRRPNPIGLTAVRLLGREGNILRVKGLDALDGTPVLDIKPYSPRHDLIPEARVPAWVEELERMLDTDEQGPPPAARRRGGQGKEKDSR